MLNTLTELSLSGPLAVLGQYLEAFGAHSGFRLGLTSLHLAIDQARETTEALPNIHMRQLCFTTHTCGTCVDMCGCKRMCGVIHKCTDVPLWGSQASSDTVMRLVAVAASYTSLKHFSLTGCTPHQTLSTASLSAITHQMTQLETLTIDYVNSDWGPNAVCTGQVCPALPTEPNEDTSAVESSELSSHRDTSRRPNSPSIRPDTSVDKTKATVSRILTSLADNRTTPREILCQTRACGCSCACKPACAKIRPLRSLRQFKFRLTTPVAPTLANNIRSLLGLSTAPKDISGCVRAHPSHVLNAQRQTAWDAGEDSWMQQRTDAYMTPTHASVTSRCQVSVEGIYLVPSDLEAVARVPNLQCFGLTHSKFTDHLLAEHLPLFGRGLTSLDLRWSTIIGVAVRALSRENVPLLQHLDLSGLCFMPDELEILSTLPCLKSLRLESGLFGSDFSSAVLNVVSLSTASLSTCSRS